MDIAVKQRAAAQAVISDDIQTIIAARVEQGNRQQAINFARNSVRLEGVIVTPEDEFIIQRYIDGEIDVEQAIEKYKDL